LTQTEEKLKSQRGKACFKTPMAQQKLARLLSTRTQKNTVQEAQSFLT